MSDTVEVVRPPLVPAGRTLDDVCAEHAQAWMASPREATRRDHEKFGGHVIRRIRCVDENSDATETWGRLLQMFLQKVFDHLQRAGAEHLDKIWIAFDDCEFPGHYSLTTTDVPCSLAFTNCRFPDTLYLPQHVFDGSLDLSGTTMRYLSLSEARIAGSLRGVGLTVEAYLWAEGLLVSGDVDFSEANLSTPQFQRAVLRTSVSFDDARFSGWRADFSDATLGKRFTQAEQAADRFLPTQYASFQRLVSEVELLCDATRIEVPFTLTGAQLTRDCTFSRAVFLDEANFIGMKLQGKLQLVDAEFHGPVAWTSAELHGDVQIERAAFREGTAIENLPIGRTVPWYERNPGFAWSVIRGLGELTFLSRASYVMLLVAPVAAALWPAISELVNKPVAALKSAATDVEQITNRLLQQLPAQADRPVIGPVVNESRELLARIQAAAHDIPGPKALLFPLDWLLAYLAAFSVAMGQVLYQVRCPALIRSLGPREWGRQCRREFLTGSETERQEALRNAFRWLHDMASSRPWNRSRSFLKRSHRTIWIPGNVENLARLDQLSPRIIEPAAADEASLRRLVGDADGDDVPMPTPREPWPMVYARSELEPILVEEGALAEYELVARENSVAADVSGLFYLGALFCLGWLLLRQFRAVWKASNVMSLDREFWSGWDFVIVLDLLEGLFAWTVRIGVAVVIAALVLVLIVSAIGLTVAAARYTLQFLRPRLPRIGRYFPRWRMRP